MTDKEHIIPLKDVEAPSPEGKKKKINGITSFLLIFIGVAIFFISPAPAYLLSLTPDSFIRLLFSSVYEEIIIDHISLPITEPQKIVNPEPFPVFGRNTGLCFTFSAPLPNSNKDGIDIKTLEGTKHGESIAEIIAVSKNKTEYQLDNVTSDIIDNKVIICQKFSNRSSIIPDDVKDIYIRPLEPLTPNKVVWRTMKSAY